MPPKSKPQTSRRREVSGNNSTQPEGRRHKTVRDRGPFSPAPLPPPAHLTEAGAKIWRSCAVHIAAADGAIDALRAAQLETLVHALLRQRQLAAQIEAAPVLADICPTLKLAEACAGTVRRLVTSLGLGSAGRQRLPRPSQSGGARGGDKWADLA